MRFLPRPSVVALVAVLVLLPFALPNNYMMDIAIRAELIAIAVIGLNFLMGFAGQISVGHAAFIAVGAYGSGIATTRFGWPPIIALLAASAGSALFAWIIAVPILRLRGHSLTIATLGLGIIANLVLVNESSWTGGPDGMPVDPFEIAGFAVTKLLHWYVLAGALLVSAVVLSLNLFDSPAGRALRGLSVSEVAARAMGVDVPSFKVWAFVASAVFATVAGSLTAHYIGFVSPALAAFTQSVELATMVVLGGMGSTFGAVLGAVVLTILPQLLGGIRGYESLLYGLILMLTIIFLPRGLVPSIALRLKWRGHA